MGFFEVIDCRKMTGNVRDMDYFNYICLLRFISMGPPISDDIVGHLLVQKSIFLREIYTLF